MCHKGLSGKVFGTAHSIGIALKVEGFKPRHRHGRSGHVHPTAEGYGEGFGARLEVHGLGTCKEECTADFDERGRKHAVAERVGIALLGQHGTAHGGLLGRIEHRELIDIGFGLLGNLGIGHHDGLGGIVDRNHCKHSLTFRNLHIGLLQRTVALAGFTVTIFAAVDGHRHAVRDGQSVLIGPDNHFR